MFRMVLITFIDDAAAPDVFREVRTRPLVPIAIRQPQGAIGHIDVSVSSTGVLRRFCAIPTPTEGFASPEPFAELVLGHGGKVAVAFG